MKNRFSIAVATLILLVAFVSFVAGCAQLQTAQTKVSTWWNSPATQAGLQIGLKAAGAALVAGAESAGIDYLTGEKVSWTEVGKAAGASALRSIELTPTASQPVVAASEVADAVLQASNDPAQAQVVKTAVIAGLTAAQASGANASGALEGVAQALDAHPTAPGK